MNQFNQSNADFGGDPAGSGGRRGVWSRRFTQDGPVLWKTASALASMSTEIQDWSECWPTIATIMAKHTRKAFNSQGSSIGRRWQAPSQDYQKWKNRYTSHRAAGKASGNLFAHMTDARRALKHTDRISMLYGGGGASRTSGDGLPYARPVQWGWKGTAAKKPSPTGSKNKGQRRALPYLWWTSQLEQEIFKTLKSFQDEKLKKVGLK